MTDLTPHGKAYADRWPVGYAYHPATGKEIRSMKEVGEALTAPRHLGHTQLEWNDGKEVVVSTVHLVINHSFGMDCDPVLWETMMFGDLDAVPANDDLTEFQVRYQSESAARTGHVVIVNTVTKMVVETGYAVLTRELTESLLRRELAND